MWPQGSSALAVSVRRQVEKFNLTRETESRAESWQMLDLRFSHQLKQTGRISSTLPTKPTAEQDLYSDVKLHCSSSLYTTFRVAKSGCP